MIKHTATVTVNKPPAEVFKFVGTDYFSNHPKWDSR
ncbi:MAG: polyketide cyclase, partial [SAR202 cluster bacterium]|nr:polyketide cyclase [SAR202 cluster bacterium]